LKVTAADKRKRVAEEQSSDDAAYWPIYNLDQKNPSSADALEHRPPQELVDSILEKEREILRLIEEVKTEVAALRQIYRRSSGIVFSSRGDAEARRNGCGKRSEPGRSEGGREMKRGWKEMALGSESEGGSDKTTQCLCSV